MADNASAEQRRRPWIAWVEWAGAVLLTLAAVTLQVVNLRHAGGLWRDEVAAVNLAQMPSWSAIWTHLEHESFPLLITVAIRIWSALGFGDTDAGLRALGFLVSLGLVAAIWLSTWRLAKRPPAFSLLLIALSPVAIRWGGSMRAYGLGVLLALLALAAVWALIERRSWSRFGVAALASVLAVQALYQNALVVLAVCLAAAAVAATRRDWTVSAMVGGVGALAGLSLLPYAGVISRASEWNVATAVSIDFARIWLVLHRALTASGPWMLWLWATVVATAVGLVAITAAGRHARTGGRNRGVAAFLVGTALLTAFAYLVFLKVTKFPTEEWYYLLLLAVVAVAADVVIARASGSGLTRLLRPAVSIIAAACMFPAALKAVQVRATNLDMVASRLRADARAGDLVVVQPWFCGVTLARYYAGPAEMSTVPPLADVTLQRLDLFKEQMQNEQTLAPLLERIQTTLRSGRTVWLVGHFPFSNPPQPPPVMPRAGEGPEGWRGAPYMAAYGMHVAYFIQMHALQSSRVHIGSAEPVHPFENLPVRAVSGWRTPSRPW
jgi:hypothetical protein